MAVDFDPALNADTGGSRVSPKDLEFQTLDELLEPLRAKYRVPALAVAAARSNGVFAVGAVGVRVAGANARVTPTDRFHLGSCGKSITASVAARMVERGQIEWDTTIRDAFPNLPEAAASVYASVTLRQLLAHRSGFPPRDDAVMKHIWALEGDSHTQRGGFVRMALQLSPVAEPGSTFLYSDIGYTVAGVMLEQAAKKSWEELVEEHVAIPLTLTSLGFGEPASPGAMDQPWGHVADGTRTVPFSPGPYAEIDNPAVIGPAGLVHLSIVDWGTYAGEHLKGARGQQGVMLSPDTYRVLHRNVEDQNYALGWGVSQEELGSTLTHTGSCGEWFSVIKILPDVDLAIVVATNVSGGNGVAACNDALQAAVAQFNGKQVGSAAGPGR
ncbi:MAG: beta-lactamase family protein [Candidatus Krumholzibacteria bacterium]|nr:beta-lactamase family protein [Candidatus Krumholzibacteria bacterium]